MSKLGKAGRFGTDVRSDCYVECELLDTGGIVVDLESKVMGMFGRKITEQCQAIMASLGVAHARVTIRDAGALPWALSARIEAAAKQADPGLSGVHLVEPVATWNAAAERQRLRRSRLYLPGNEPKFMVNAGLYHADGLILDLEDSVAPEHKRAARYLVRNALRAIDFGGAERMVRINQGQAGLDDLTCILEHNVHVVLVPKVESSEEIKTIESHIRATLGAGNKVFLMPIIESAKGGLFAYEIATASPSVIALAIGLEDYTADIGTQRTKEGKESLWLRQQVINAARAAGIHPIDTVFSDVADMDGLRESVLEAKALGFDGKGCIHPRQIPVIHDAFAPSPKEIERAIAIVRAFDRAAAQGLAAVAIGSKMIDPPVVKRALHTVDLAIACQVLPATWREQEACS